MNPRLEYLVNQLRDPTTWRGITMLLTALGVSLNPDQVAAITAAGMAIVGLIAVFAPPVAKLQGTGNGESAPPASGQK